MCLSGEPRTPTGDYELRLSETEVVRFKKALADFLVGDEPDIKVLREMSVRLRCATRRRYPVPYQYTEKQE